MPIHFITKKIRQRNVVIPKTRPSANKVQAPIRDITDLNIKKEKKDENMISNSRIHEIDAILKDKEQIKKKNARVKIDKKDKGLIETAESATIVLTEDNKMLLTD